MECENASHLGGPMGTEYTTPIFSKPFTTIDKAKKYAEDYVKKEKKLISVNADWKESDDSGSRKYYCWDAMAYIFYIRTKWIDETVK